MKTTTERPGYVRRNGAAKMCDVSIRTIADWQKHRRIPYSKIGGNVLFKIADLEAFVDRFRVEAREA